MEDDYRSGAPITAYTIANIERVRKIINENPHSTYVEIEEQTFLHPPTIKVILNDSLGLRRITSRWAPHLLSDANRKERVDSCLENLTMFSSGKWRLSDVVTGDESWIYWRHIGRKKSNSTWIAKGESPSTVVRRNRFEPKTMFTVFFKTTGPVLIDCMPSGQTINTSYYKESI